MFKKEMGMEPMITEKITSIFDNAFDFIQTHNDLHSILLLLIIRLFLSYYAGMLIIMLLMAFRRAISTEYMEFTSPSR